MQKRHQIPFIKDVHLNSPYLHWILYNVENCKNLESFGKCMQSFTAYLSIWGKVSTIVTSLSMTPFCHFFCSPLVQFPKKQTKKQGHSWDVPSFQLRAFWEPPDCKNTIIKRHVIFLIHSTEEIGTNGLSNQQTKDSPVKMVWYKD